MGALKIDVLFVLRVWATCTPFMVGRHTIKFHYLKHIATESKRTGSPNFYHTYRDESYHQRVRAIARRCHAADFASTVLSRLQVAYNRNSHKVRPERSGHGDVFDVQYVPSPELVALHE